MLWSGVENVEVMLLSEWERCHLFESYLTYRLSDIFKWKRFLIENLSVTFSTISYLSLMVRRSLKKAKNLFEVVHFSALIYTIRSKNE